MTIVDPLAGSPWSQPGTVEGFVRSPPNEVLAHFAHRERARHAGTPRAIDIGCGAGRNAIPLARIGWDVVGTDLSWPMLAAAARRVDEEDLRAHVRLVLAPMDQIPAANGTFDLVIAHGIWNLARSGNEFRRAVAEAARVAAPDAALFVFTFSRHTLAPDIEPMAGEPFVFREFSGQPQCFLTDAQLVSELGAHGFTRDPSVPFSEYNLRGPGALAGGPPAIYEAAFRARARS